MNTPRSQIQTRTRPNIVFFLADELGFADLACYGRPDIATPGINRIAAEGVRLTQAYRTRSAARSKANSAFSHGIISPNDTLARLPAAAAWKTP